MMNNQITYKQAKGMDIYKFNQYRTTEEINYIHNKSLNVDTDNIIAVLEFGNVDIELIVSGDYPESWLNYITCTKFKNHGWETDEHYEFNESDLVNVEEAMFNKLMQHIERYNRKWDSLNEY